MSDREKAAFRRACRSMSEQLGTPGFEGSLAAFWKALAAIKKEEIRSAN